MPITLQEHECQKVPLAVPVPVPDLIPAPVSVSSSPLQGSPPTSQVQFQLELLGSCTHVPFWGGKGGDAGQFDSRVIANTIRAST